MYQTLLSCNFFFNWLKYITLIAMHNQYKRNYVLESKMCKGKQMLKKKD